MRIEKRGNTEYLIGDGTGCRAGSIHGLCTAHLDGYHLATGLDIGFGRPVYHRWPIEQPSPAAAPSSPLRPAEEIARGMVSIDRVLDTGAYFALVSSQADEALCLEDNSTEAGAESSARTAVGILTRLIEQSRAEGAAAERERVKELTAERDEARDWVRRLTATQRVLTCVYCGQAYPPGTPEHGAGVLTAHVRVCEKHPMREAEAEVERMRERDAAWQRETGCEAPEAVSVAMIDAFGQFIELGERRARAEAQPRDLAGPEPTCNTPCIHETALNRQMERIARKDRHYDYALDSVTSALACVVQGRNEEAARLLTEARGHLLGIDRGGDLAGRIRALVQEYAGRWADTESYDDVTAFHDAMTGLRTAFCAAKHDDRAALDGAITWMRSARRKADPERYEILRQAADELEAIVRVVAGFERK